MEQTVKVRMLVDTAYKGALYVGDEVEVPLDFAERWRNNHIAEIVMPEAIAEAVTEVNDETGEDVPQTEEEADASEVEDDDFEEAKNFEGKTSKQLYQMCIDQGIDAETKQPKKYYINLLTSQEA